MLNTKKKEPQNSINDAMIMTTLSYRQCGRLKMLPIRFSITKLGEGALIIRYTMNNCFLMVLLLLKSLKGQVKGHKKSFKGPILCVIRLSK